MKVVACSEPVKTITGYAKQMVGLVESVPVQWHVVEDGVFISPESYVGAGGVEYKFPPNSGKTAYVYPGMNKRGKDDASLMVANIVKTSKADAIFTNLDPHMVQGMMQMPWTVPLVYWLAWDSNTMFPSLAWMLDQFERKSWELVFTAKFAADLAKLAGYKSKYVYLAIDESQLCQIPDDGMVGFKKKFSETHGGCPVDRNILLYVGRNSPRKNIEGLLGMLQNVVKTRNDVLLILRTSLKDPAEGCDIISEIYSRKLEKYVVIDDADYRVGQNNEYLNRLYNMADLYVSASCGEGFGLPIAEAGYCGKTFVIPEGTTATEFMGDTINGIACSMEPDAVKIVNAGGEKRELPLVNVVEMADRVNWLLDHPKQRTDMGKDFKKWVTENCTRKVVSQKMYEVLKDLNCTEVKAIEADD